MSFIFLPSTPQTWTTRPSTAGPFGLDGQAAMWYHIHEFSSYVNSLRMALPEVGAQAWDIATFATGVKQHVFFRF